MTNEAKTAKMETIAVETSLEEPPAVPPEKIRIPKIRLGSNKIYGYNSLQNMYYLILKKRRLSTIRIGSKF